MVHLKVRNLAGYFGLEYRIVESIPKELNHYGGYTLHLGNIFWVESAHENDVGMAIHELSHWILAAPDQRKGFNFAPNREEGPDEDEDSQVCLLDAYLMNELGFYAEAKDWAQSTGAAASDSGPITFFVDRTFDETLEEGRRLWYEYTGLEESPSGLPHSDPVVGLPLEFEYGWDEDVECLDNVMEAICKLP